MKKNTCLNISLDKVLVYICIAAIVFEVFINFRVGFLSFSNIIIITSFFLQCLINFILFICWCALSIVWTPYSASGAFFRIIDTLLVLVMILSVTQYCTKDDKIYVSKCEDIIKFYIFCTVVLTLVCYCAEGYRLLS